MSDARRARIAELRRIRDEADAEMLRLAREEEAEFTAGLAEAMGTTAEKRDAFKRGDESIALQPITKPAKVMSDMVDSHRVALSVSRVKRLKRDKAAPDGPFMTAIQAKGFTQATLAAAIGIKQPTLSAHRKPKGDPNSRPIPTARAQRIQELTSWPADSRHWPCGLSD